MKRTTVYLEPELELELKAEARRLGVSVAELIRDALRRRVSEVTPSRSSHAGAFVSGRTDTADRADDLLRETGFGGEG